jgi:thiosulfate dehydrogenase [quinone] large subunit
VIGAVAAGAAAGLGRAVGGAPSPTGAGTSALSSAGASAGAGTTSTTTARAPATTTTTPAAAGTRIGLASQVPVGGAATFTDPATGDPGLVLQLAKDQFVAYDAVCPHAGCTVGYAAGAKLIVCPCHGSEFDPATGAVVSPPAPRGLTPIHVAVSADGSLLADG